MIQINTIFTGDVFGGLKQIEDNSIHCCVTSPPYWNLRDYQMSGQLGLEKTPEEYISKLVAVFREVKRVLRDDGTIWVNIGDTYAVSGTKKRQINSPKQVSTGVSTQKGHRVEGLKPKDLVGIPWMLAFALRTDGWYLRQDIIWHKKNCMPESVTDRCTKSHEYIFMLSKSQHYYYDADAIKEPAIYDVDATGTQARKARQNDGAKSLPTSERSGIRQFKDATKMNGKHDKQRGHSRRHNGFNERWDKMTHEEQCTGMRNKRDVWTIAPAQYPESHFATFPEEIPAICIKAGSPIDGLILDPFIGAGTTAMVARKLNRNYIGIELNPEYVAMAENRLVKELGMFQ